MLTTCVSQVDFRERTAFGCQDLSGAFPPKKNTQHKEVGKLLFPAQKELMKPVYVFRKPGDPLAVDSVPIQLKNHWIDIHGIQRPTDKTNGNSYRSKSSQPASSKLLSLADVATETDGN